MMTQTQVVVAVALPRHQVAVNHQNQSKREMIRTLIDNCMK